MSIRWGAALTLLFALVLVGCDPTMPPETDDAGALRDFGEPCRATEDCTSGLCLRIPGTERSVCTAACVDGAACPSGWGCIEPDGFSARVCGCASPRAEVCDNRRDDDCNGRVDDCRTCNGVPVPEDSPEHCGTCGNRCTNGQECVGGACSCPLGTLSCGGNCLEVETSNSNCGACGRRCGAGSTCVAGECTCVSASATYCGDICADLQTSAAHCGACDDACPIGASCVAGACSCGAGQRVCGDRCVATQADTSNCGACGVTCAASEVCNAGVCTCPGTNERNCDGTCIDVYSNPANCGRCGNTCRTGETCFDSACRCDGRVCGDACVPNDASNCGACGVTCRADQFCAGPSCACPPGTRECGGRCTPIDVNNCSACGDVCAADQLCHPGGASCTCATSGETFCAAAGECVNLRSDPTNCGTCGRSCTGTAGCTSGVCTCPAGQTYCESVGCVDLRTNLNHCGRCDLACTAPLSCNASVCSCPFPTSLCGSACVNRQTDNAHCGSCGNVCAGETVCTTGTCRCPIAGQTACGGVCYDFQTDENNCGGCGVTCTGSQVCTAGACSCPSPTGGTVTRLTTNAPLTRGVRMAAMTSSIGVLWRETADPIPGEIWFQRVDLSGVPMGAATRLGTLVRIEAFDIATNGTEWLATWSDGSIAFYQRIAADGTRVGPLTAGPSRPTFSVATAWSPTQGWVLVGGSTMDAWMQFLGPTASAPTLPVALAAVATYKVEVAVAPDGTILVVHDGNASRSLVAQPVNADGSVTSGTRTIATSEYGISDLTWDGHTFVAALLRVTGSTYEQYVYRGVTLLDRVLVARQTGSVGFRTGMSVRDRRAVLSWSYLNMSGAPANLWTARVLFPDSPVGAPTVLAPPSIVSSTTTVDPVYSASVVYSGDEQVVYAWADTRWGQTETYTMSASLGMCR